MARYAVGDIHGCLLTLRELLENRLGISQTDQVVLVGDYVDRGPRSRQVLEYINDLLEQGYSIVPLRGNHDDLIIQGRFSRDVAKMHLVSGGAATFASFGVTKHQDIPWQYCDFIDSLPFYYEDNEFVCVHASLNVEASDPFTEYKTMLWSRLDTDDVDGKGRRIIAGHTPQTLSMVEERIQNGKKIILDTGCCYHHREGYGILTAMELETFSLYYVKNIDSN